MGRISSSLEICTQSLGSFLHRQISTQTSIWIPTGYNWDSLNQCEASSNGGTTSGTSEELGEHHCLSCQSGSSHGSPYLGETTDVQERRQSPSQINEPPLAISIQKVGTQTGRTIPYLRGHGPCDIQTHPSKEVKDLPSYLCHITHSLSHD